MESRGLINAGNDLLAEDGADVVCRVGLVVFFVDDVSNVLVFHFVDFQVEDFFLCFV